ncbi:vWA domain-containing protein [Rhodococcus opacus]|uniref:vWA domain-containing protein n=1 Tax=Rhodococcus opacus TaxID=37919 RepID=UPI00155AED9A|nr:vWA domain-containing protein [Rhodococcus opacus]
MFEPLRRRPKRLTEAPNLYHGGSGGGHLDVSGRSGDDATGDTRRQPTNAATTNERGAQSGADSAAAANRREAHRLVHRLALEAPWESPLRRGGPNMVSLRWDGRGGEVDVDRTVASVIPGQRLRDDHIFVRRRMTRSRSVVLLIDVSGSMKGGRIKTAAAAIGSLAGELTDDAVGVVAFWSDASVVLPLGERRAPSEVLDMVLDIPARGLTNVGFGLSTAIAELDGWPVDDARIILLSDCVHNAGPDPRPLVLGGPRIDVLLDVSEEHDERVGRDLARATGGQLRTVRTAAEVPAGLTCFFAS